MLFCKDQHGAIEMLQVRGIHFKAFLEGQKKEAPMDNFIVLVRMPKLKNVVEIADPAVYIQKIFDLQESQTCYVVNIETHAMLTGFKNAYYSVERQ